MNKNKAAMQEMHWQKYGAEALGTFTLTLGVLLSLGAGFPIPTPLVAGLILGLFVYTIGPVSGSHINPAVTIGLWSVGKISIEEGIKYIIAQLLGALVALHIGGLIPVAAASVTAGNSLAIILGEGLGAFFFVFGIAAVAHDKVHRGASGLVIGSSLLLGILIASVLSNGVLNPAVAFGIGSLSLSYVLGPIVGAILGATAYKWIMT